MNKRMTKKLVIEALLKAVKRRKPSKVIIFHSDLGSQYANHDFQNFLLIYEMKSSMSHKCNYWGNAVTESFFSSLKTELIYHNSYQKRYKAKQKIFEYIKDFYNKNLLHPYSNYKNPEGFGNKRKTPKLFI